MRHVLIAVLSLLLSWANTEEAVTVADLTGLYSTSSEISGFTGTTMYLSLTPNQELSCESTFYSDVKLLNMIEQDVIRGGALFHGGALILARPYGFYHDKKPFLHAIIDVYHPVKIKDRLVLMRKDAYQSWV